MNNLILDVLRNQTYPNPDHRLGRPFMTTYQIAIDLEINNPGLAAQLGYAGIGGRDYGEHDSFASYLGRELTRRAGHEPLEDVEGAFFSDSFLKELTFDFNGTDIESSLTGSAFGASIFRLGN
jgi:hypothetical protein